MIRNEITSFQEIPNVGKTIEKDFYLAGLKKPIELINKGPYQMYDELCKVTQQKQDPCVLDIFFSAVNCMKSSPA